MVLNVNTDAVVALSDRLEKIHRSAFPSAVRGALNSAALDVKKGTLLKSANKHFENRSPNFFKAFSKVNFATGFDVGSMKSTVGFTDKGLVGGNNHAVKDLEQQERGGKIGGRSFIPTSLARGGNNSKPVRPMNRISKIKNIANARNAKGVNSKQRFVKSVHFAGKGGYVLSEKGILWRVNSLNKTKGNQFKLTALYSVQKGRSVKIKSTEFMSKAAWESGNKLPKFYKLEAERQFTKFLK